MLINLNEVFELNKGCTIAFNFCNIENLVAILEASKRASKTVIASFGEGYINPYELEISSFMARKYASKYGVDIVLHLDHAKSIDTIKNAISCGFTSVMYDGSKLNLEENIENTKYVVDYARKHNVTVEGELGYLNDEDGKGGAEEISKELYTTAKDAKRFCLETGVDALAISVGNAHGIYKGKPAIDIVRIEEISKAARTPLVLHGSSGIDYKQLNTAVEKGIRKINVNTDLSLSASQAIADLIKEKGSMLKLEELLNAGRKAAKNMAYEYLTSVG